MHRIFIFSVLSFIFHFLSVFSQVETVKKHVQELSSSSFHGRGYVYGGDSLAADYIASQFRQIGLDSLTNGYFQPFDFPVNTFPSKVTIYHADKELKIGEEVLVHHASPSYKGTLHFQVISVSDFFSQDDTTLINRSRETDKNALAIDLGELSNDSVRQIKRRLRVVAQEIPVVLLTTQKFIWSVSPSQLNYPIIEVRPSALKNNTLQLDIEALWKAKHATNNVLAYLPAKKKTSKTIVFTAHYDHLGRLGTDVYFPGANDNASGTAVLLTLAQEAKKKKNPYNLLFIAFAGEEIGLKGSEYYVKNPILPLQNIHFLINLDMVGSGEHGMSVVNGEVLPQAFQVISKINQQKSLLTPLHARGTAANSDHHWFFEQGVPAFFIYTSGESKFYHDIFDTYESLSFAKTNELIELLLNFADKIAKTKK